MKLRRALVVETGGAVFVEQAIAIVPVLFLALATWQLTELWAGQLLLGRAASAAARAAAVVLPDDPAYYDGVPSGEFGGRRRTEIELAAALVLAESTRFLDKPSVTVSGAWGHQPVTATVTAAFACSPGFIGLVCGGSRHVLRARATQPYQGAEYRYPPRGARQGGGA